MVNLNRLELVQSELNSTQHELNKIIIDCLKENDRLSEIFELERIGIDKFKLRIYKDGESLIFNLSFYEIITKREFNEYGEELKDLISDFIKKVNFAIADYYLPYIKRIENEQKRS